MTSLLNTTKHSRIVYGTITIVLLLALLSLLPITRGVLARNLAWLSLQRAVLGKPEQMDANLERAGVGFARAAAMYVGDDLSRDGLGLVYLHYHADDTAAQLFAQVPPDSPWEDVAKLHLLIAQTAGGELTQQGALVGGVARDWCDAAGIRQQVAAFTALGECDRAYEWLTWMESRCELPASTRSRLRISLGTCYVEQGEVLAGIGNLEEAVRLTPDDPEAWLALGDGWLAAEDAPRALEAFRAALQLTPESEGIKKRIQSLNTP